jgi:hypothetical protein
MRKILPFGTTLVSSLFRTFNDSSEQGSCGNYETWLDYL